MSDLQKAIEVAASKVLSDYETVMNVKAEVRYIVDEFRRLNKTAVGIPWRRRYAVGYRTIAGKVHPFGDETVFRPYAERELEEVRLSEPGRDWLLVFRDVPEWSEVAL